MSLLGNLLRAGIKSGDDLARKVLPVVLNTGDRVLIENTTNALRNMGARVPSLPGPGLMGTRSVPSSRQLGAAPKPAWGSGPAVPSGGRVTNTLTPQPFQGPRQRGGAIVPTSQPPVRQAPARTQYTEDLIRTPALQGPSRPPVQGPSAAPTTAVQGQLDLRFPAGARSAAEFTTAKGAVRPAGTNIAGQPYRSGPVATERNLETAAINAAADALETGAPAVARIPQGQGSFFLENAPDIWTDSFRMRPELIRQLPAEVQQRIGTTMARRASDLGTPAPRPAFGPGAGPAPVDRISDIAFARNAAGGNQLVDLMDAVLRDPFSRTMLGITGASLAATGIGHMMPERNRTGETTAGTPPMSPVPPLFRESDGTPLGSAPGVAPGANLPAPGNIDPSAPAAQVTSGGLERESSIREALAQAAPGAAAVMRAVEPMSPEKYRSIEEYAAAREAYAQAKPEIQALMRYMETQSPTAGGGLAMWASRHPGLAQSYQAQQQALRNPAASQQSPESITTTTVTAPIGSEVSAAAVGNAAALSDAAVAPSAGASDMVDVTRPQIQPNLQRVQDFLQRQAPRSRMYAGY